MRCNHCLHDWPQDGFYKSNPSKCKECIKTAVRKHRAANLERARAYDRMRGSMPHRVAARKAYQATSAFAGSHRAAAERWAAKHPERRAASFAVSNAVRDGKLLKLPCLVCGVEKVEGHHPDYSRPLDVVWLCNPHHREVHDLELEAA